MSTVPHARADHPQSDPVATRVCQACGAATIEKILPLRSVPLYCNVLWEDRELAANTPRGSLLLTICRTCGHVFNQAFELDRIQYDTSYDNSLHYSEHFSGYAQDLARRLVAKYSVRDKFVVDIGCGLGKFLELLCRVGGNRGQGFDRSCPADTSIVAEDVDLTFVPEFFSHKHLLEPIDFLCCRQVLEHIANPSEFLAELTRSPAVTPDTILFFEVPNSAYTFQDDGIWDLIYEHCSYFSKQSFVALFERCGFEVITTSDLFSEQYLGLEARLARGNGRRPSIARTGTSLGAHFADKYCAKVSYWRAAIAEWAKAGERIVIWGAGSKGVSFLDTLRPNPLEFAVDLNPCKAGKFLPGSGAQVVAPEFLTEYRPDRVILMNAVYRNEVSETLSRLGLSPTLVAA